MQEPTEAIDELFVGFRHMREGGRERARAT